MLGLRVEGGEAGEGRGMEATARGKVFRWEGTEERVCFVRMVCVRVCVCVFVYMRECECFCMCVRK